MGGRVGTGQGSRSHTDAGPVVRQVKSRPAGFAGTHTERVGFHPKGEQPKRTCRSGERHRRAHGNASNLGGAAGAAAGGSSGISGRDNGRNKVRGADVCIPCRCVGGCNACGGGKWRAGGCEAWSTRWRALSRMAPCSSHAGSALVWSVRLPQPSPSSAQRQPPTSPCAFSRSLRYPLAEAPNSEALRAATRDIGTGASAVRGKQRGRAQSEELSLYGPNHVLGGGMQMCSAGLLHRAAGLWRCSHPRPCYARHGPASRPRPWNSCLSQPAAAHSLATT